MSKICRLRLRVSQFSSRVSFDKLHWLVLRFLGNERKKRKRKKKKQKKFHQLCLSCYTFLYRPYRNNSESFPRSFLCENQQSLSRGNSKETFANRGQVGDILAICSINGHNGTRRLISHTVKTTDRAGSNALGKRHGSLIFRQSAR